VKSAEMLLIIQGDGCDATRLLEHLLKRLNLDASLKK
jgi:hypothetical protein